MNGPSVQRSTPAPDRGKGAAQVILCACLLGACGAPRAPATRVEDDRVAGEPGGARSAQGTSDRAPAASYLQDEYERIFPERVRIARYGALRFAAADPGDAAGEGDRSDPIDMAEAPTLVVVDRADRRVRVITQQDHYRLLVWLDAGDLYPVITDALTLAADGAAAAQTAAAGAPGVRVRPGLAVAVDGERRGMVRVSHRDGCVSVSGWVPRGAVTRQFVPVEVADLEAGSLVAAGSQVVDRPGGRPLARFQADCEVTETGPEVGGFRPILYATEWLEVRGWVGSPPPASSAAAGSGGWGYGVGHLGLLGARSRFRLPEGTCLYGRRAGSGVGVVTDDADFPITGGGDGWWQIPIETAWGDLLVWVAEQREVDATVAGRRAGSDDQPPDGEDEDEDDDDDDDEATDDDHGGSPAGKPQANPRLRRCR